MAQAKAQLEVAKKNLADCRLLAPVSGVVGKKMIGAGETALPSQAVVTILDISSVKVRVSIPEAEISAISRHTPSTIQVDAIGKTFEGGEIEKGVQADALTHTYDIYIKVENKEQKLLPGMVAKVRSLTPDPSPRGEGRSYLVPLRCVQKRVDGGLFVWTVDKENGAHRTDVSIGETVGNKVKITSGLTEGQRVVTEGYQKLSEGTKVVF